MQAEDPERTYRTVLTPDARAARGERGAAAARRRARRARAARCRRGRRFPRCRRRWRRRAPAAGGWRSSPTPTATSSPRRRRRSACRSTRRSSPPRSAPTSRVTATGRSSSRGPTPTAPATCTSPRASSTTSPRANELGLKSVWVNRLGETADPQPTREIPDLRGLAGRAGRARPGVSAAGGFTVRPATLADAAAVAELMNAFDRAYVEEPGHDRRGRGRRAGGRGSTWSATRGSTSTPTGRLAGPAALYERNDGRSISTRSSIPTAPVGGSAARWSTGWRRRPLGAARTSADERPHRRRGGRPAAATARATRRSGASTGWRSTSTRRRRARVAGRLRGVDVPPGRRGDPSRGHWRRRSPSTGAT